MKIVRLDWISANPCTAGQTPSRGIRSRIPGTAGQSAPPPKPRYRGAIRLDRGAIHLPSRDPKDNPHPSPGTARQSAIPIPETAGQSAPPSPGTAANPQRIRPAHPRDHAAQFAPEPRTAEQSAPAIPGTAQGLRGNHFPIPGTAGQSASQSPENAGQIHPIPGTAGQSAPQAQGPQGNPPPTKSWIGGSDPPFKSQGPGKIHPLPPPPVPRDRGAIPQFQGPRGDPFPPFKYQDQERSAPPSRPLFPGTADRPAVFFTTSLL